MSIQNKIFSATIIPDNSHVSKIRYNREYLLSQNTAAEFNTYLNFGVFKTFNDVYAKQYDKETGEQILEGKGPGTPGVRSLFNRAGAVLVGCSESEASQVNKDTILNNASEIRISNNVPLMDSPSNRRKIKENSGCSIRELVQASSAGILGRAIYSYADFMYCKHLGKLPNNHLITLRRFPTPILDHISATGVGSSRIKEGANNSAQQIGCLVTWLGTPGNEMSNILKYSYNMPFKEMSASWNSIDDDNADSQTKVLNGIAAAFDPTYRKQYQAGYGGATIEPFMSKFYGASGPYDISREKNWRDSNKVYGPIDRVKSTYMRSEDGLQFVQDITLTFDYELRSYNGVNARQAFLDLLSNILNVTYSTGDFWGGGYIGGGMHQNSIFANMAIFKANGGFSSFVDAFAKDYSTITSNLRASIGEVSLSNVINILKMTANQLGGMILGGMLNKLGRPQKVFANSLLSEAPVGFWHVMIGNPFHPILSMGNMILKNTTIEHYGPLGLDDFPTGIKVVCELTRGKPRDIREIEKMYMNGNDKIYYSMGPKVLDMYENATDYKLNRGANNSKTYNSANGLDIGDSASVMKSTTATYALQTGTYNLTALNSKALQKAVFGETDTDSIIMAAKEQDFGSTDSKSKS